MLLYRVFPYDPEAKLGESGHPMYIHRPQGQSRLDNPDLYDTVYFGVEQVTAVGETFANLDHWTESMFPWPGIGNRCLGTYQLDEEKIALLDLDDANALLARGLRPTQVVSRTRAITQEWARRIFEERNADGTRKWDGVRWWSFHRPQWSVVAVMIPIGSPAPYSFLSAEELDLDHAAVRDAAQTLGKTHD